MLPLAADTLNEYLPGGTDASFTDGDKTIVFESFTDTVTCYDPVKGIDVSCALGSYNPTTPAGLTVAPSTSVSVTGLDLPGFTLEGLVQVKSFVDSYGNYVDVTSDIALIYSVTATAGEISDIHLGVGGASVTGTTSDPPAILISESTNIVGADSLTVTDPPPTFTAALTLTPSEYTTSATVTKDISLESGAGQFDQASFSVLEQSFSEVPEPRAYAAVLGLFLAFFFVIKRRRQLTA
jgi:hypothetical protein